MYIGIDFLIDRGRKLFLSEVNTGVPAGAFEYDLVYREHFGKPSGIFNRINNISKKNFSLSFKDYVRNLSYIDDLKMLKIWMDGKGVFPSNPSPRLRIEDKWIQYNLLSPEFDMLPTEIYDAEKKVLLSSFHPDDTSFVIKRRLGRGGQGFRIFKKRERITELEEPENHYIVQPWINSSVENLSMSVRATAFCGEFICMFASLSPREVSNHGYRFYVKPGNRFGLLKRDYRLKDVVKRSWEAEILFGDNIPSYLKKSVMVETISDDTLIIPEAIYEKIIRTSQYASHKIANVDYDRVKGSLIP